MLDQDQLRETLTIFLDHTMPACAQIGYRLVGTATALLQGVPLPVGDVDILVKERESVDAFALALASFKCLVSPAWIPHGRQYYAEYEVGGVRVGISTVEWETDSDAVECLGRGPWEHYVFASCGPYAVPAVALELRLVSELSRDRPDRYIPLIQHLRENGCDLDLVRRGMEARDLSQAVREDVLDQIEAVSGRSS